MGNMSFMGSMPMADVMDSLAAGVQNATAHAAGEHAMRRGGGGGGDPIAKPIGLMMVVLAFLSFGAHLSRQSQISAALLTGLLFGWARMDSVAYGRFDSFLKPTLNHTLIELGNVLVLFFAGLSVDVKSVREYWWQIIVVGSGYGVFATALFALLGWGSGLCEGPGAIIFFGVCCSLSSKQLMVDHLYRNNQYKTLHSKILQGIALFQDVIAIFAMAILDAFEVVKMDPDQHYSGNATNYSATNSTAMRRGAESAGTSVVPWSVEQPDRVWHDRFLLGDQIGMSISLTIAVGVFFCLLNYFILERLFRFFTVDGEMLFIGTMAYNLGSSAICHQLGFSPMIGSYFAGLSLSFLPSRHQIEHKISSLRGYGMTTFYFMMGIYVHIDGTFFEKNFGWSVLFTLIVVVVGPVVIWVMGWVAGLTSRTTVYTSLLSNSLGETTLTLQVLAYQAGIFNKDVFLVLVVTTLMSINLCCIGTIFIDKLFHTLRPLVGTLLDAPSSLEKQREQAKGIGVEGEENKQSRHVVILGFNETGQDLAEFFRERKQEVFVVDLDPALHAAFKFAYKGVRGHRIPRCAPIEALETSITTTKQAGPPAAGGTAAARIEAASTVAAPFDGPPAESGPAVEKTPVQGPPVAAAASSSSPLPGAPDAAASSEAADGVAVAGQSFGVEKVESADDKYAGVCATGAGALRLPLPLEETSVAGTGFGQSEGIGTAESSHGSLTADAQGGFTIDGFLFGSGTNIFSVLADPELEQVKASEGESGSGRESEGVALC